MLFYNIVYFVSHQVQVREFISDFHGNIQQYIQHVDMARWQDEQFRICRDTFPLEAILSMVDLRKITPYNHKMKFKVNTITQSR